VQVVSPSGDWPLFMTDYSYMTVVPLGGEVFAPSSNLLFNHGWRVDPTKLKQFCRRVQQNTGLHAFANEYTGMLEFFKRIADGRPITIEAINPAKDRLDEDTYRRIYYRVKTGRVSRRTKEAWAKSHERKREYDKEQSQLKFNEDARPEMIKAARFQEERRGMGRHWKKSVVVN